MLFVLEEIGIELAMVLAVAGSIGCFVYLLTLTFVERHELRRLEVARAQEERHGPLPAVVRGDPIRAVTPAGRTTLLRAASTAETAMTDVAYIVTVLACFCVVIAYARVAPRL